MAAPAIQTGQASPQYQPSPKEFATARARLAIAGHALEARIDAHGLTRWTISRCGMSRTSADWSDVLHFLSRVEVRQ